MDDIKEEVCYNDMLKYINKAFLKGLRRYLDPVQCKGSIKVQYVVYLNNT